MLLSFPAQRVRRDAFCGGRASAPLVEMELSVTSRQLPAFYSALPGKLARRLKN